MGMEVILVAMTIILSTLLLMNIAYDRLYWWYMDRKYPVTWLGDYVSLDDVEL